LRRYDPKTNTISPVKINNLPSDPKDPSRKNNVDPTDIPSEKAMQRLQYMFNKMVNEIEKFMSSSN
jgi:hypothetical protein